MIFSFQKMTKNIYVVEIIACYISFECSGHEPFNDTSMALIGYHVSELRLRKLGPSVRWLMPILGKSGQNSMLYGFPRNFFCLLNAPCYYVYYVRTMTADSCANFLFHEFSRVVRFCMIFDVSRRVLGIIGELVCHVIPSSRALPIVPKLYDLIKEQKSYDFSKLKKSTFFFWQKSNFEKSP